MLNKWQEFKSQLPHMSFPYSKRNWGSSLHSICSYQGKMKPALAYHLVESFSNQGDIVLDPFSGSGTIPLEAAINGRIALGMDIGLLATSLSNAKLKKHNRNDVEKILDELERYIGSGKALSQKTIEDTKNIGFNKSIPDYYHEDTLSEILLARDYFLDNSMPESESWPLVFSCLLHILHGNRPYALSRNSHPITPYAPTGEYVYKNLMEKLRVKVYKSIDEQENLSLTESKCYMADILSSWPKEIKNVNAIITSPPFFDSTKFYMTNWLRYWFCGWGKTEFDENPKSFVEVVQKRNFDVYDFIFSECHRVLVSGGVAVFHLGHSDKCDMAQSLTPFAEKYFEIMDVFTESVEHCEKHGIKDKGSVKGHQYLVLRKRS
ncbi:site-specific DNA-methyltransferase [Vibrio parahaemolyticus]|uniref:DNA methyltransferase n=2 Tax=Gammaproteobacteria TaxID=1236 RepID=UPI00111DE153|nr:MULTISPECIES: DNA methyltransferase [Gammaproteobacteria]KAB7722680.1 SAM-dependent methyltransferase [Proteus mirabilis]MBE3794493.1 site-specific DNA-methyltransferase [Vibrio parahaemolyticus]MBE3845067.1 site-specific DNA-methyltransferase [Vibrio parahaemolyticus]MCD1192731.1 hypothetical protein [Vibrio cholerae]MEA5244467.1 DNA methyltransferase [Vibrio parahaemolyticus]